MPNCDRWANHDLIEIYNDNHWDGVSVVRWCKTCGAVVVDEDCDVITYPGRVMKMKVPDMVKNQLIKEGLLNA